MALQETRSILDDPLHGLLAQSHRPYVCCDASSHGTAGHGLALYVHEDIHERYHVKLRKLSPYVIWLQFDTAIGKLLVGTVYIPQRPNTMQEVYDTLVSDMCSFHSGGAQVICIGDFNAHVGTLEDRLIDPFGQPVGLACARDPDPHSVNSSGRQLVNLCMATGTLLCTGRSSGGCTAVPVVPSFTARGAQTRPDHCIVSTSLMARFRDPRVLSDIHGSDHLPLHVGLDVCSGVASASSGSLSHPEVMLRLCWDPDKRMDFYHALGSDPAVVDLLAQAEAAAASQTTLDLAVQLVTKALFQAAAVVGMRTRVVSGTSRRRKVHQPWFDAECKAASRALRGVAVSAQQARELRSLFQRKERQHAAQQYSKFQQFCRSDPTYFWKALRRGIAQSSPVVPTAGDFAQHFAGVFQGPAVVPSLPSLPPPTTVELDDLFGDEALQIAFKRLKRRASPGKAGIPVPALASPPIRHVLQSILRAVHLAGQEPPEMALALLCPIYKRGDHSQQANYRPIVVSSILHKLYANCLGAGVQAAHSRYSQQHGDLFPRQTGFLPDRSTLHNLFVVQHLAHHALHVQRPHHGVFLDVEAAYDTTNHAEMVDTLLSQELPQHLVRGIAGMYQGLQYQVVANGAVAKPFPVGVGVKQGCPLSPILYNLYVQPLSAALSSLKKGPCFPGVEGHHPDFHYADDIALVAEALPDLQSLLSHTACVLAARKLKLSVPKCVALVLGVRASTSGVPPGCSLAIEGVPVTSASITEGTRYLGLIFDSVASASTMASNRASCFASSFHAATAQMRAASDFPSALSTFLPLLHTVMEPAGLYGSELWGLLSIPGLWSSSWSLVRFYSLADPLEVQRCRLIRQWLHLPSSVPSLPLLHELGCEPLVHCYLRRAVRFYNALLIAEPTSVYQGVLRQNVQDAFASPRAAHNFVGALFAVLRIVLPRAGGLTRLFRDGQPLDGAEVEAALSTRYAEHVAHLSRVVSGSGSRIGLYFRVVGTHALGVVPPFYSCTLSHGLLVRFLRFRLGCHHLRIHTGRWSHPPLPRSHRRCLRCPVGGLAPIDDEAHCLWSCAHPDLEEARERFLALLVPLGPLQLRSYADFWALATGGRVALPSVVKFVAQCVRVCWSCHRSGGTDIVDIPEVILDPDHYLDLFDSESDMSSDLASSSSDEFVEVS